MIIKTIFMIASYLWTFEAIILPVLLDVWTRNLRLDEGLRRLDKELALG
jgi:hypothetical protein